LKINIIFSILLFFYSLNLFAANIRVVDLQILIDKNKDLEILISNIEKDQIKFRDNFKLTENKLQLELERIDELKLILDNAELKKEINKYNQELNKFNLLIEKFNNHYENQINKLKNKILEKILEILKKYSSENKIDLILDTNSYILSSNSINITNLILDDLNKINFDTSFEQFK